MAMPLGSFSPGHVAVTTVTTAGELSSELP